MSIISNISRSNYALVTMPFQTDRHTDMNDHSILLYWFRPHEVMTKIKISIILIAWYTARILNYANFTIELYDQVQLYYIVIIEVRKSNNTIMLNP